MARHLYIGNNIAVSYSAGVLANKAIDVQKLSASGPTSMVAGDTIADSERFRIVQGNGTTNIVSPWIYGRDVIDWSGKGYSAQVAQVKRAAFATNATVAGEHTLKVMNKTNGNEPFEQKSYTISVAAGATPTTQCTAFTTAINNDLPHWINGNITNNGTSLDFTGFKKGETKADGSVQEDLVLIEFSFEAIDGGGNGTTMTESVQTPGSRGVGDYHYVQKLEDISKGVNYGFYHRGHLPNTPVDTALVGGQYDMYHIAATKDGSSSSQINGVDNIIEINIALDNSTPAITQAFENKLNSYLASANFSPVIL
tara:strand:+ start:2364 stop:3296 length:933 start_codon:yes stop_codon:yes gene_type:complete